MRGLSTQWINHDGEIRNDSVKFVHVKATLHIMLSIHEQKKQGKKTKTLKETPTHINIQSNNIHISLEKYKTRTSISHLT